ncbi:MAG: hypothetical protein ACJ76F_08525 [Bacteroidia bacterium]
MLKKILIVFLSVVFFLIFSCSEDQIEKKQDSKADSVVTYAEHIAPVLFDKCTSCHRPGEAGPFNLLTYNDAVVAANKIRFTVETHFMPPWPADPEYTHFIGERVMSREEIDLVKKWIAQGKQKGDTTKMTAAPLYYKGSFFGKPDLVVKMQKPVFLKGNGTDHFLMIKIPYTLPHDTFARYFEFVPHQRKLVHHVNGHLISYNEMRSFDYYKGESTVPDVQANFKDAFGKMKLGYTDNKQPDFPLLTPNTVYYLPGYVPPVYPEDIGGYVMKKNGAFLLKNIHYGPTTKDVWDSSCINVFFMKSPPKRPVKEMQMGTFGVSAIEPALVIPPNEIRTFHTQLTVPQDISVLSVNPHMHLLGKTFLAYALTPSRDTIRLIRINKWDFRWQYYYTFRAMVKIPAGSVIHAYGSFDNTDKNPFNPFSPPREISQGEGNESMQTTEEMFQFIFTYLPYQPGDEKISLQGK